MLYHGPMNLLIMTDIGSRVIVDVYTNKVPSTMYLLVNTHNVSIFEILTLIVKIRKNLKLSIHNKL